MSNLILRKFALEHPYYSTLPLSEPIRPLGPFNSGLYVQILQEVFSYKWYLGIRPERQLKPTLQSSTHPFL